MLDAALCHSHSQYALLSISIIAAPQGHGGRKRGEIHTHCLCLSVCVNLLYECYCLCTKANLKRKCLCEKECTMVCVCFHAHHLLHREQCVRACVCEPPSQPSVVFSSSLTVIPLSAICPSLKHQLFSKGPLGERETTGRLHFFFYPHKDVLLLPVLLFFQEVFAARLSAFRRFYSSMGCLSLSLSLPLPLSLPLLMMLTLLLCFLSSLSAFMLLLFLSFKFLV